MVDASEDAVTTLAGVMALIDAADSAVEATLAAGDDPWLAKARAALGYAGKHVTAAARLLRPRYERPEGLTLLGYVVGWGPMVAPIGALAYLCRGPLHLAAAWTALICVAALFVASLASIPPWRAITRRYVPRRFTVERAARRADAGRGGTGSDVAACLDAILRARKDIVAVAGGHLSRRGLASYEAASLVAASRLDRVVAMLRTADGHLASGYDAVVRSRAGAQA